MILLNGIFKVKTMKKIYLFVLMLGVCSCTNMSLKTQRIQSATDCVKSERWSWNDGVASTTDNFNDISYNTYYGRFSFKSKLSGNLSFKFQFEKNSRAELEIFVEKGSVYKRKNQNSAETVSEVVKIPNVSKGSEIFFVGAYCSVSEIVLSSIDEEDDSGWDF